MTPSTGNTMRDRAAAFTRIELMAVLFIIFVLISLVIPYGTPNVRKQALRVYCLGNLKQVGVAYQLWANDHQNRLPAAEAASDGGWRDLLAEMNQGSNCWTNYVIMASEMGRGTRSYVCPEDERQPPLESVSPSVTNMLRSNTNVSYFVGVSANYSAPWLLLGGDRNLGRKSAPGDFGFSPMEGQGNDVAIQTNAQVDPLTWGKKMHSRGLRGAIGNVLLTDGSSRAAAGAVFREQWQPRGGDVTNWPAGHVPVVPSYRVLFP